MIRANQILFAYSLFLLSVTLRLCGESLLRVFLVKTSIGVGKPDDRFDERLDDHLFDGLVAARTVGAGRSWLEPAGGFPNTPRGLICPDP